ncbi:hypothetical protein [Streptomyces sp. NPDC056010]|uniref:hypothetical protein n=1 Tax=Streptomyces sp. NPDC056010 TaxID=3345679 RepID=UPI0035D9E178
MVFDKLIWALVSGMGYERVADATCSATTLRKRLVASDIFGHGAGDTPLPPGED